jgi:hypothetical protein
VKRASEPGFASHGSCRQKPKRVKYGYGSSTTPSTFTFLQEKQKWMPLPGISSDRSNCATRRGRIVRGGCWLHTFDVARVSRPVLRGRNPTTCRWVQHGDDVIKQLHAADSRPSRSRIRRWPRKCSMSPLRCKTPATVVTVVRLEPSISPLS